MIDLTALTFIDGAGLRMLVKLNHHELEPGRPVTIVRGYDTVERVLDLASVSGVRLLDEVTDAAGRPPLGPRERLQR